MYPNQNPFGSLPQYGQQMQPGQMQPQRMAGPGGFNGQMTPPIMQGMPGQMPTGQMPPMDGQADPNAQHHGHHGFNPAFLMGMLPGLLAGGHLSSIAPMFGLAGMFGRKLFK